MLVYILLILFAVYVIANIFNPDLSKKIRKMRIELPKKEKKTIKKGV